MSPQTKQDMIDRPIQTLLSLAYYKKTCQIRFQIPKLPDKQHQDVILFVILQISELGKITDYLKTRLHPEVQYKRKTDQSLMASSWKHHFPYSGGKHSLKT